MSFFLKGVRFSLKQQIFVFGFCFIVCFYNQAVSGNSIDYNRDIRPVLSRNCFSCHGPDDGSRKAGLRLDIREGIVAERKGNSVVVLGKRNESELYARLLVADKDELMPPPDSGHELTTEEIELIGKWIDGGVVYDRHWAFVPPVRPKIPEVKDRDWVRNAIDNFILSDLEATGHHPNKMADRYTIIRRLSLDLTGLPPSPAEVEAFLNDKRLNAYESLVDDLLSRPAYGERWARLWLDLARFADSSGYGSDPLRVIWKYRDWVIDAFNKNMPYDQFTVDQLAGDLLTKPSRDQLLATAFHRNTKTNTEGGTDDEEFRTEAVRDRVDTTMQVWMGLTMGCAKCHTHKYDPITQKEYYQFYSFFNQSKDADRGDDSPRLPYPTKEQSEKIDSISKEIKSLESKLNIHTPELANGQQNWELKSLRDLAKPKPKYSAWEAVGPFKADSFDAAFSYSFEPESLAIGLNVAPQGAARQSSTAYDGFAKLAIDGNTSGVYADNSVTHTQNPDDKSPWWEVVLSKPTDVSQVVLWNRAEASERLSAFRILGLDSKREVLFQEDFFPENKGNPQSGEGFSIPFNAKREVSIVRLELLPVKGRNEPILSLAEVQVFSRTANSGESNIEWLTKSQWNDAEVHDLKLGSNETIYLRRKLVAQIEGSQKISLGSGGGIKVWLNGREVLAKKMKRDAKPDQEVVTVSLDKGENEILVKIVNKDDKSGFYFDLKGAGFPEDILPILLLAESDRTSLQRNKIEAHYRTFAKELDPLRKQIELKKKDEKKLRDSIVTTPYMQELPKSKRRKTHLLVKGNFLSKGEQVQAGFPEAFHKPNKGVPLNRLGVAKWLLQEDNPLTARVAINRFWAQFFGRGLLDSEEDFGTQGNLPDHPELLDWLAVEFQEKDWDMKSLIKTIVMSATYSQSAKVHGELAESDFRNIRLGRGPRFRLEAEMVRDQALALSGLKSKKMYGPSVYPPQPPNLWQAAFNGQRNWATSSGEDRYRRGFYTFLRRTVPYPSMATFDAPSREICAVRRIRTNTPLQSFVTMNDEAYVEFAQAMAYRIYKEGGVTAQDRIKYALRLTLSRPPEVNRFSALSELYQSELAYYSKETEAAKNLYGKIAPLPIGANISEMAAFTVLANVLLNLDAILMKG